MTVFYILDGFDHSSNASSIDLNAVRLCFQAFLSGSEPKKFHVLTPVVSDVIYDKSKKKCLFVTFCLANTLFSSLPLTLQRLCRIL